MATPSRRPTIPSQEPGPAPLARTLPVPNSSRNLRDRFIPVRSAMNMDVAGFLLTSRENTELDILASTYQEGYKKLLASILLQDHYVPGKGFRILKFNDNPVVPSTEDLFPSPKKHQRSPRHIPQTAQCILDAPNLADDHYLNLLDWSARDVVAIGLGNNVYLWNAKSHATVELTEVQESDGPITSVSWDLNGTHIAVGLNSSEVQLWDSLSLKKVRTLTGHTARVGSLSWNSSILSSGSLDGKIFNHDVRVEDHKISRLDAHGLEVCGLKWSLSCKQLASGGDDKLLYIWDVRNCHSGRYLHRMDSHRDAVKALAWCPYQSNLLASGGGTADGCVKLWNTHSADLLKSLDTNSEVCSLQWNSHEKELLSSHGFNKNQLTLWKFPTMRKITELTGHSAPVLHLAQSPDGFTVASASADESLRFWQIFGSPRTSPPSIKHLKKDTFSSFSNCTTIRQVLQGVIIVKQTSSAMTTLLDVLLKHTSVAKELEDNAFQCH